MGGSTHRDSSDQRPGGPLPGQFSRMGTLRVIHDQAADPRRSDTSLFHGRATHSRTLAIRSRDSDLRPIATGLRLSESAHDVRPDDFSVSVCRPTYRTATEYSQDYLHLRNHGSVKGCLYIASISGN